jgi:hypothetical protein
MESKTKYRGNSAWKVEKGEKIYIVVLFTLRIIELGKYNWIFSLVKFLSSCNKISAILIIALMIVHVVI